MAKNVDKFAANLEKKKERETRYLYMIARIYVMIILAVFPLCVGFEGYDNIIYSKALVFWTVSIVFLILFGLFYFAYRLGLGKTEQPLSFWKTFSIPDWAALAFLLIITISCILSPYKDMVFLGQANRNDGWLTYFCMIMSYFVLSRWYRPNQLDFAIYSISSMLVCVIGFMQFHGNDFMNLFPYYGARYVDGNGNPLFSGYSISFRSTLGNINFVSIYVCIAIVIFGILYIRTKGSLRFLYLAASIMNFDLMIIASSDAGKVGVFGAMILLIPYWMSERESFGRFLALVSSWSFVYVIHHWIMINKIMPGWNDMSPLRDRYLKARYSTLPLNIIFSLCIVLLAAGLVLLLIKKQSWPKIKNARITGVCVLGIMIFSGIAGVEVVGQRVPESNIVYEAREMLHGRMQDSFGSYRGFVWRKSLEQFGAGQPFFGTGSDTFIYAFGEKNQEESKSLLSVAYDKAHNDFLQILLCNGILAFISYLALMVSIVIQSMKKAFNDDILLIGFGGLLAYFIQSFFGIDTIVVTPIFWIILAIVRQRQSPSISNIS